VATTLKAFAFGVARDFCSGLALIMIMCCLNQEWSRSGFTRQTTCCRTRQSSSTTTAEEWSSDVVKTSKQLARSSRRTITSPLLLLSVLSFSHFAWSESKGVMPSAKNFASGVISKAQVNVSPVAKLLHSFAKCGICLELARSEHQKSDKNSPKIGGWG